MHCISTKSMILERETIVVAGNSRGVDVLGNQIKGIHQLGLTALEAAMSSKTQNF
ncbi:hypothetical protein Scep_009755 [Stephania cephalantha]|uniref:Uncharacterized protein n=1 Tax=Stephania cephalantha TaxID=152367 RepID=A0AAP0JUK2_9MAGN